MDDVFEVYTSRFVERTDDHARFRGPLTKDEQMQIARDVSDLLARAWDAGWKLQIDYKV